MAINFPNSPNLYDVAEVGNNFYIWNGVVWVGYSTSVNIEYNISTVQVQDNNIISGNATSINFADNLEVDFSDGVATISATGGGTGGGESYWEQTSAGIHTLSNVGIGTTNPTETLTVVGDARVTGILTIGTSSITLDGNTDTIVTQSVESNVLLSNDVNVSGITTSSTFSTGENGILITQNEIFSNNLVTINSPFRVVGNFFVDGEQTVINTSQLQVTDKLINLGNIEGQPPSNITADGGGIILKGSTDKVFLWSNFTNSWSSNVNINIGSDDAYKINNEERLSYNQLNVPNANITGVITASQYRGNGSGLSGIVTSIIAGSNINISSSAGQVTISAAAIGGGGEGGATGVNVYDSQGFIGFASAIDFGDNLVVSQLDVVSGFVTVTGNAGGGESTQWGTTSVGIHTLSNVGIGTTNPTSALTVSGNARFTGIVTASSFGDVNASSLNVSGIATISQGRIQANGSANLRFGNLPAGTGSAGRNIAIGDQVLVSLSGGQGRNIGIGELSYYDTTTGQYNIGIGERAGQKITTGAYNVVLGAYDGNSGGLDIRTSSRNVVIADGEGNIRQYINSSGNVGIKTTVVTEALTVAGIVSATGFYGTLNAEQLTGTLPAIDGSALIGVVATGTGVEVQSDGSPVGTAATINFGDNLNVDFSNGIASINAVNQYWTETSAGIHTLSNVGIGTTNPQYKLHVVGSFGATTKSFIIDHPTKVGKKLQHGSLEGPENGVYVRGRSQNTIIELPDYWNGLVDEDTITVNLTPIGDSEFPRVRKIENNKIEVFSKKLGTLDYYFTVFGERKDVEKLEVEF